VLSAGGGLCDLPVYRCVKQVGEHVAHYSGALGTSRQAISASAPPAR